MPLVDLSVVVNNINKKLDEGNFHFDKFEIEIIMFDSSLYNRFIKILTEDYKVWQSLSDTALKLFGFEQAMEFTPELLKNYLYFLVDKGKIGNLFDDSVEDPVLLNEVKEYLKEKLKNSSYVPDISFVGKETLKLIVDAGRLDLLYRVQYITQIFPETENFLREYYYKNNLRIPDCFYPYMIDLDVSLGCLSLKSILLYLESGKSLSYDDYYMFLQSIRLSSDIITGGVNWANILARFNGTQREEVVSALLNKGYYEIIGQTEILSESNVDKFVPIFIHSLSANNLMEQTILVPLQSSKYELLLSSSQVIEALIKNDKLLTAASSPIFKDFIFDAVAQIENNPEKYVNLNISYFDNISSYPDILFALYKTGNRHVNSYLKNRPMLLEKVKASILNGETTIIPSVLVNDDDFINQLISLGRIDLLSKENNILNRFQPLKLYDTNIEIVINKAKNDYVFAMEFLSQNIMAIINTPKLLHFYLQANEQAIELIVNRLNHLEENEVKYTTEMYQLVKTYLVKKYGLNEAHLEVFANHFGPLIIRYAGNENIKRIINMSDEDFNKLLTLFPKIEFTMVDVEKIYDSLKQFEFSKMHSNDIEIFARINHSLADGSTAYLEDIEQISSMLQDPEERTKFYRKFNTTYPELVSIMASNPKEFLLNVVNYMQNGSLEEKNYYTDLLHFITDYYIAYKREKYRDHYDMYHELSLPYELDSKDTVRKFIKYCAVRIYKNLIVLEMTDKGIDESLAIDCVDYYGFDKRDFSDERIKEIERHIKMVIEITNNILNVTGIFDNMVANLDAEEKIKRKYYVAANDSNQFAILAELNMDLVEKVILADDNKDLYQSLLTYIYKYKLHLLPNYFKGLMASEHIDINLEVSDVASFISYYGQIYEAELKRLSSQGKDASELNLSFVTIMKYAEAYSSVSSVYNQLLGIEDARLIKSNPKPNAATNKTQGDARLKEAVEWTLKNFERTEVTIPTFNEVINVEDKKLRAVVGNFTHPANLTMGERTGACMRIGGVGDSLFNFVLENKNGFHIRFEDPESGEFISRVSGFRNGNTIFLNELRYSCNPANYSNADVVEACKKVAEMLVEKSKDSTCPIDNVMLHHAYATEGLSVSETHFDITDNREGLPVFYCDIKDKGIVLASNGEPFTKINFDKSQVPSYSPAREECYQMSDTNKLRILINRVHAIKYALSGISYEYIAPMEFEKGIYYGIANQDFYIYIDTEGNIFEEIINVDPRAQIELESARKAIWDMKLKGQYLDEVGLASFKM